MSDRQTTLFSEPVPQWEDDDRAGQLVARVVFPIRPLGEFDYLVPDRLVGRVAPSCRVKVPLGKGNRAGEAYCVAVGPRGERTQPLKPLVDVLDDEPLATQELVELARWVGDTYLCSWGQALQAMIPAGVRDSAGTREMRLLSVPVEVQRRLSELKLPKRQLEIVRFLAASSVPLTQAQLIRELHCTPAPIAALLSKELIEVTQQRRSTGDRRLAALARVDDHDLNAEQRSALKSINEAAASGEHESLLLLGVTGSGKTEVYIRAIQEVVSSGRQAIVLVPEISLTPQTVRRFRERFDSVAVLHSHLGDADRHDQWRRIARGEIQVVVGARSAIFAPLARLGLIVIDEEHESSFKQESTPRYHAREVALERCRRLKIPLVLGSATPSLESYQGCSHGDVRLVELPKRVLDRPLPLVSIVDLRSQRFARGRTAISRPLEMALGESLESGGQAILLLNRRGYSTHVQCPACGEVVQCPRCDVSLTFHRQDNFVQCHYCEYRRAAPTQCAACGHSGIRYSGLGTQRLEDEVRQIFPEHPCCRMDTDTTRARGSHERLLEAFRRGESKILLGTQMIAKGLDFPNVTLVGVVLADVALHLPDFRAAERTFQLLAQVAGRTGRGPRGGHVIVQTFSPEHPAIEAAASHHFTRFAAHELSVREAFGYPPFGRQVRLVFEGPASVAVRATADSCAAYLRESLAELDPKARIMGPAPAPFPKLRNDFRFHLLLHGASGEALRTAVRAVQSRLATAPSVRWYADVDPQSML